MAIRAAFLMGMNAVRDYMKNPPRGLLRLADNVHAQSKSISIRGGKGKKK
jgi:hypothetical protein